MEDSTYVSFDCLDNELAFPPTPSPCPSSELGWSIKDEILLDPDDRPLELAVTSKSPMTFHLKPGNDRNQELLKALHSEQIVSEENSVEGFNMDNNEYKQLGSVASSINISSHRASLSGSSANGSTRKLASEKKKNSPLAAMTRNSGHKEMRRKTSLKEKHVFSSKSFSAKPSRSSSMNERPSYLVNGNPTEELREKSLLQAMSGESSRTGRIRQVKQKKEAALKKPARSASARKLFSSLRKYRMRSSSRERASPSDAEDSISIHGKPSPEITSPGVLKIFGDTLSPGTNYKSVMATTSSTAEEVLKIALERYSIPDHLSPDYVLCEVVGKVPEDSNDKEYSKSSNPKSKKKRKKKSSKESEFDFCDEFFVENNARPLNSNDEPLVIQSYWKPVDGLSKRFEIRRQSKMQGCRETRQRNVEKNKTLRNSRSNKLTEMTATPSGSDNDMITSFEQSTSRTFSRQHDVNATDKTSLSDHNDSANRMRPDGNADLMDPNDKTILTTDGSPPSPYLITLQGNEENLIHHLDKNEVLIGSDVTDFKLLAPDVLAHHCVIKKRLEFFLSEDNNCDIIKRWCVSINPLSSTAEVRINRNRINSKHALQHGDLISVGKQHLFMYKDPSSHINLVNMSFTGSNQDSDNCSTEAHGSHTSLNSIGCSDPPKSIITTHVNYLSENKEEIVEEIFKFVDENETVRSHHCNIAATLLCQCIEHACLNFNLQQKNDLILKIASTLQTVVLNATRNVSVQEIQSSIESDEACSLGSLQPVVFWMSNSFEIFLFLQNSLPAELYSRVKDERQKSVVDSHHLESVEKYKVNEEVLTLLEEVVMYAFQQIVYYLTKSLYGCLPAILECNPFVSEQTNLPNVNQIIEVFSKTRDMSLKQDVNEIVIEELFAYLFFFTNVSLFNTLMEEGSYKYYKWEMGVRIRGNLEVIESWAERNGFLEQCIKHLDKMTSLSNLLAIPRREILKSSWTSLRENFPALSPSQLHVVLSGYQTINDQLKPSSWFPNESDLKNALNKSLVQESYDTHPPFMLPPHGTKINVLFCMEGQMFIDLVERLEQLGVKFSKNCVATTRREQPDGKELPKLGPKTDLIAEMKSLNQNNHMKKTVMTLSELKASEIGREDQDDFADQEASKFINKKQYSENAERSRSKQGEGLDAMEEKQSHQTNTATNLDSIANDSDQLLVLPITSTHSLLSKVSPNKGRPMSPSSVSSRVCDSPRHNAEHMPKEVFIVDLKKGPTGLGVGLVDGLVTSLGESGAYVHSLLPDDLTQSKFNVRHRDVIRCWLLEGRLQLGDRILAANGISLINMTFCEATNIIKEAGDSVRLLVGRCEEYAAIITSFNR